MRIDDLLGLLPLIIIALFSLVVMGATAVRRNRLIAFLLTVTGFVTSITALLLTSGGEPRLVTRLLLIDGFSAFYVGLILGGGLVTVLLSYDYLKKTQQNVEEYYILLLLATTGAGILVTSVHVVSLFLGLELLGVSLYALIAFGKRPEIMIEAAVKYLILTAVSNAFLLFGTALLYAQLGTMHFFMIGSKLPFHGSDTILTAGLGLILVAFAFKLALVPFHMWAPDVYQGAPAPVAAYVATVSKGAIFALLLRLFALIPLEGLSRLSVVLTVLAIASMLLGNLLALFQHNLKRLLAYSSISHFGYLLVALLASGPLKVTAISFYLVAYFVTTLGIFGIIALYSSMDHDADLLSDYRGLFSRNPLLAVVATAMLFSLAGIPLTAGFIGKFFVVTSGVGSSLWLLVIVLIVTSAIGLFYYLRAIVTMYLPAETEVEEGNPPLTSRIVVTVLLALLILWGTYPTALVRSIEGLAVRKFPGAQEGHGVVSTIAQETQTRTNLKNRKARKDRGTDSANVVYNEEIDHEDRLGR